jgi:flavin reductase (DIM6/NTAB) family NADH-FMN oxidoreductase RutF
MKKSLGPKALLYPTPVMVIGSYDAAGKPNMMTAAWGGICCSQPPCVAVSLRKATHTYGNLTAQKAFTVNLPSQEYLPQADYFGTVSGKSEDKLAVSKLTAVSSRLVNAPYLEEFPVVLECRVLQMTELGLHTQFIGEILDVKVNTDVLGADGLPDPEKIQPCFFAPETRVYYGTGPRIMRAFSTHGKDLP